MNLIENTPQESEKSLTGNRQTPLEHSLRHFVGWFIVQEITVVTITKWERKKKKNLAAGLLGGNCHFQDCFQVELLGWPKRLFSLWENLNNLFSQPDTF